MSIFFEITLKKKSKSLRIFEVEIKFENSQYNSSYIYINTYIIIYVVCMYT